MPAPSARRACPFFSGHRRPHTPPRPTHRIVIARCAGGQLSDEVGKLSLGKGRTPYRMLAHPSGRLFVFADQPKGNLHRVDVALRPEGAPELTLDPGAAGGGGMCGLCVCMRLSACVEGVGGE